MKSISLLLLDDSPRGRIKYCMSNWSGVVYRITRSQLTECHDLLLFRQNFVYILVDDDSGVKTRIFAGCSMAKKGRNFADNLINQFDLEFNDWNYLVVFGRQDEFSVGEIELLVKLLSSSILNPEEYEVVNGGVETGVLVKQNQFCDVEEFFENVKIILGVIGIAAYEAPDTVCENRESEFHPKGPLLTLRYLNIHAVGQRTDNGFLLLKGSQIRRGVTRTCSDKIIREREKYAQLIGADNILIRDIFFSSPSAAAGFAVGARVNGITLWIAEKENHLVHGEIQNELF